MKLGVYRHYKGNYYLVLGVAAIEATHEKVVVYVPLYTAEGPRMWVRPYDEFNELVVPNNPLVDPFVRFVYIGEEMTK